MFDALNQSRLSDTSPGDLVRKMGMRDLSESSYSIAENAEEVE